MLPKYLSSSHRVSSYRNLVLVALMGAAAFFCLRAAPWRVRAASTFTVMSTADSGAGSLRQAITDAASGDTINFNLSGCPCTITLTTGELVINKSLAITGPGSSQLAVSGNNASRVFFIGAGTAVELRGLTVTGGNGASAVEPGHGGGIYNNVGTLTIIKSTISGNHPAFKGGGIFNHVGTVRVIDSTISDNAVNTTGGGINNNGGMLAVINSTVLGNSVNGNGGGIFNLGLGNVTVTNSTVTGNSAGADGGGIHNFGTLTVTNSTVIGNRADSNGSGGGDGGGLFASTSASASETLNNSIVAGNFRGTGSVANDINGTINTASHNIIGDFASAGGIDNGVNGNIVNANPMLAPLAHYGGSTRTYLLLPGSPAINAGDSSLLPTDTFDLDGDGNTAEPLPVDQRGVGFARAVGNPDIGAVERQATDASNPLIVDTLADDATKTACTPAPNDCSLRGALANANSDPNTDDIYFAVTGTITLNANGTLPALNSNMKILGPGANALTVKRDPAAAAFRIFTINSGKTITIAGITITNGATPNGPNAGATWGAGIFNDRSVLTVSNCSITGNATSSFGAGGGIYNFGGTFGGSATLTVINSTISGNSAPFGGGIYSQGNSDGNGTLTIINSTLSGNSASSKGGAIFNQGALRGIATLNIHNSTFSGNSAPDGGGIINHNGSPGTPGTPTVKIGSTILNVGGGSGANIVNVGGIITSDGYNLSSDNQSSSLNQSTDQNSTDPMLGALSYYGGLTQTHALLCGSPAIDKGKNFAGTSTDQRGAGFPRIFNDPNVANAAVGDATDIGAFEVQSICNRAPTAVADGYSTNEDNTLNVASPGVLGNDSDPDAGDSITTVLVSGPTNAASFTLNADGSFDYAPTPNFNGSDSFTYKARDSHNADSNTVTVTISVNAVNDAPSFTSGGDVTVAEDSGSYSAAWASGISAGPSDESGQTLTFMVTGNSNPGLFSSAPSIASNGTLSFTPSANSNGSATITVELTDDGGTGNGNQNTSVPVSFTITVTPVNDAPTVVVAPGGSCSDAPTISGTMNLTLGDVESPAGNLTLSGSSNNTALVPNANIAFGGSGANRTITITVAPKKTGTATITVLVSDGQASGMVTITVIVGSDKNETLNGTAGADMIFGLGGKNTINGNAGNDLICGGNGVDTINGGAGDDTIDGGNGDDVLRGDAGNDILNGELGNDRLEGGGDSDTLTGGLGADFFSGGPGIDSATDVTPSQGDTQDGT